jgi:predicted nucleic acid-binding protein
MSEVFADSFYYIALLNPNDQFHAIALEATRQLQRPIVTTLWILTEVGDALSAITVRKRTHDFLRHIQTDPNVTLIADPSPWYERGLRLFGSRADKNWSLTDCISFEVMTHRQMRDALTGDHHFVQAGFRALLLPQTE